MSSTSSVSSTSSASSLSTYTYNVIVGRKNEVELALSALAKRAARKGIPGSFTWTWGKAFADFAYIRNVDGYPPCHGAKLVDGDMWQIPVTRVPLTIQGETPKYAGWRFLATLQHLEGENIVRVVPGEELPHTYRNRGACCDHCNYNRRRNDTYVLCHDDGRTIQVGSSCIRDFLGSEAACNIAAAAELLSQAGSVASEEYGSIGFVSDYLTQSFLPIVSWLVREYGWLSRTSARDRCSEDKPTADIAWAFITDKVLCSKAGCEPTEEDKALSVAAEKWAENLTDEEVDSSSSDYLHNVRAAARTGLVSYRTAGLIASIITAYQRHLGNLRLKEMASASTHIGTVGDKVSFGLAPKVGKRGQVLKSAPKCVSESPLVLERVAGYDTMYGYTTVLTFRTKEGACVVWKASSTEVSRGDVGKEYTLIGTIKEHGEYKGQKQTLVTRCVVEEVKAAVAA